MHIHRWRDKLVVLVMRSQSQHTAVTQCRVDDIEDSSKLRRGIPGMFPIVLLHGLLAERWFSLRLLFEHIGE